MFYNTLNFINATLNPPRSISKVTLLISMKWNIISFLLRGKKRFEVLNNLDSPKTATMIGKVVDTHRSTVSRILSLLEDKGFVKCLDPKEPFNRFYEKTKLGKEALRKAKKVLKNELDK